MKYMERRGSGLRKIVREIEKLPGYLAAYNPKIPQQQQISGSSWKIQITNLVSDQVSEQDKSPDIPHAVLNLCIHLIAHGSDGAQL